MNNKLLVRSPWLRGSGRARAATRTAKRGGKVQFTAPARYWPRGYGFPPLPPTIRPCRRWDVNSRSSWSRSTNHAVGKPDASRAQSKTGKKVARSTDLGDRFAQGGLSRAREAVTSRATDHDARQSEPEWWCHLRRHKRYAFGFDLSRHRDATMLNSMRAIPDTRTCQEWLDRAVRRHRDSRRSSCTSSDDTFDFSTLRRGQFQARLQVATT